MPLNRLEREEIKRIISQRLNQKISEFKDREDMNKPFYFKLFSKKLVFTASLLQSIFTWFGGKWEDFAEIIARNRFPVVRRSHKLEGKITPKELIRIDNILKELDKGIRTPDIDEEKQEILRAYDKNDIHKDVSHIVNLMIEDDKENEYFFELKTVKPNKKEVRAAKRDFLEILAMRHKEKDISKVHVFLVIPFNPYFSKEYTRWTVIRFFKQGKDLLVGEDFWNFIGGENTYEDLLEVFGEVGRGLSMLVEKVVEELSKTE